MSPAEVMSRLSDIIRFTFGSDDDLPIGRETVASDVDGWDSLSYATLLIMVEKKFGVQISSDEGDKLDSVGDLADLIAGKLLGEA